MEKPSRTTFKIRLETMVQQLREDILSGKIAAGSYLPSEEVLGEQFQLSKKSVRKGLETLVRDNLIVKKPKIGNMVLKPNADDDRIVIRIGYYPGIDQETDFLLLIEQFEEKYPHIHVKPMSMLFTDYPKQAIEFMNEQLVDIVMLNYNNFRYLYNHNALHLFKAQTINDQIYPFLTKAFTVEGKLLAQPFTFSPVILCYNKEHFKQANLQEPDSSWTWDTFSKVAACLTNEEPSDKRLGFYFHLLSNNRWPLWLLQNGFHLQRDRGGTCYFQEDTFMKSMDIIKELHSQQQVISSFFTDGEIDAERLFLEGKTSMLITTYFSLNNLKTIPFEYDISPVPYIGSPLTLLLNIGLAISNQSSQKEAAQLLVNFLTSKEAQEHIRNHTLSLPSIKEAAEQGLQHNSFKPSRYQMFREIIPSFRYYTDMGVEYRQLQIMLHYLKMYWSDMDTAPNTIKSIEQALNADAVESNQFQ